MQDTEKPRKRAPGGGRKETGVTKTSLQFTLDIDIVQWLDNLGGKRSTRANGILRAHKDRLDAMEKAAETFSDID